MTTEPQDPMLKVSDVCRILNISEQTARELPLPWIRLGDGPGAHRRVYRSDVYAYIERQRSSTAA